MFLDDLFELKLESSRTREEIVSYVKVIETFYTDKLQKVKESYDKKLKLMKK